MTLTYITPCYGMLTFYSTLQKYSFAMYMYENSDVLCYCVGNTSVKKCVFSSDLKCLMSLAFLMYSGRSFQCFAAVLLKPLSANYLFLLNRMSRLMLDDVCLVVLGNAYVLIFLRILGCLSLESIIDYC